MARIQLGSIYSVIISMKFFKILKIKFWEIQILRKLTVCYYHVTYAFQSESTLYSSLNVKELLDQSRPNIWSLCDSNRIQTHNHLVHKRTLNQLAKLVILAKFFSVRLRFKWLQVRIPLLSLWESCWDMITSFTFLELILKFRNLYTNRKNKCFVEKKT